jgi:hypothetical protein
MVLHEGSMGFILGIYIGILITRIKNKYRVVVECLCLDNIDSINKKDGETLEVDAWI